MNIDRDISTSFEVIQISNVNARHYGSAVSYCAQPGSSFHLQTGDKVSKILPQPWTMSRTMTLDWAWLLSESHWPFLCKNKYLGFKKNIEMWNFSKIISFTKILISRSIFILEIWLASYFSPDTRVKITLQRNCKKSI